MVIYEMHIGTFNAPQADTPGTFADATERFRHLRELGVNAIQIMPAMEFAGDVLGLPFDEPWQLLLNTDWDGYSADFAGFESGDIRVEAGEYDGRPFRGTLSIGAYSALVYA